MNIYEQIKDDHGKQRGLCAGLSVTSGDSAERQRLFTALKTEMEAHAAAEEEVFYAELLSLDAGQKQARHSISEHEDAANLLDELDDLDMASGGWLNKFKALAERLEHHLAEEESEVFSLARTLFDDEQAMKMGARFEEAKERISNEIQV